MKIKGLKISGFRNLEKTDVSFDPAISFFAFVGLNGQGKTNILETLYLSAISKSFRASENSEMIGFNADFCSISVDVEKSDEMRKLDVVVTREPLKKTLKVDGGIQSASDYLGHLNAVFFSPDEIGLIHLAPGLRRRYLDLLLSQLDHDYVLTALQYQSVLRQRNSLLKHIKHGNMNTSDLTFWDQELSRFGSILILKRRQIIKSIERFSSDFYPRVTFKSDRLNIDYKSSVEGDSDVQTFLSQLQKSHPRDISEGSTSIGPHRDDLRFLVNDHDVALFGSRGEWRSLVLTLKFAEIELLKEKTGELPILLLDDVFSELDENRQKILFNSIRDCQTFVTTTHRDFLNILEIPKTLFTVNDGRVSESRIGH